jgi:hypothetical protein
MGRVARPRHDAEFAGRVVSTFGKSAVATGRGHDWSSLPRLPVSETDQMCS